MQGLGDSVVVEPYQAPADCIEFSVTVLGTDKGPVVLLPTEVEAFSMEDDIVEAALGFEAYKARNEVNLYLCCCDAMFECIGQCILIQLVLDLEASPGQVTETRGACLSDIFWLNLLPIHASSSSNIYS